MASSDPLLVIPAAGFGRRMTYQNPLQISKELQKGPDGISHIDRALQRARHWQWKSHVIVREDKKDLIRHLDQQPSSEISTQSIAATREWPETVLRSRPFWKDWNLLLLPDTDFTPESAVMDLWLKMQNSKCLWGAGVFAAEEPLLWGCLKSSSEGITYWAEKPVGSGAQWAWGFLFFRDLAGEELFKALLESSFDHEWRPGPGPGEILILESFQDFGRPAP